MWSTTANFGFLVKVEMFNPTHPCTEFRHLPSVQAQNLAPFKAPIHGRAYDHGSLWMSGLLTKKSSKQEVDLNRLPLLREGDPSNRIARSRDFQAPECHRTSTQLPHLAHHCENGEDLQMPRFCLCRLQEQGMLSKISKIH